jgi:hypothetical protein
MKRKAKAEQYLRLLDGLRSAARSEERDWKEEDWRRALRRATAAEPADLRLERKPRPAWAWAYGAAVAILLGAAAVTTRDFFRAAGPALMARTEAPGGGANAAGGGSRVPARQDRLAVTLVSAESGLRVHWYFDREFDWKEEIQ